MYEFDVIGLSEQSLQTMLQQFQLNVLAMYSGVRQGLVNHVVPGQKRGLKLILRIPEQNFGAVIKARNMLLWTSLEEVSTSAICCGGWIGTLSLWKLKVSWPTNFWKQHLPFSPHNMDYLECGPQSVVPGTR